MIYYMQCFEDIQPKWDWIRSTMAGTAVLFGIASNYRPRIFAHGVYYVFGVFACLLWTIVILSGVVSIMMNPIYEDQVKSIKEIVDGSFEMVGYKRALQHMMNNNGVSF